VDVLVILEDYVRVTSRLVSAMDESGNSYLTLPQEAQSGEIDLVDEDPDIVARMLIYLYNPSYYASMEDWSEAAECEIAVFNEARRRQALLIPNDRSYTKKQWADGLVVHAKLHGLSKKYDIPDLTRLSCERFVEWVVHEFEINATVIEYPSDAKDLVESIKIVYGSEQESDQILQEATIYLARKFARSIVEHGEEISVKENMEAFRKLFISMDNFAWDMATVDFEKAQFVCDYCGHEFVISKKLVDPSDCKCANRGLCGKCAPLSKFKCLHCLQMDCCRLVRRKNEEKSKA
jgi:hypothetical protein